MRYAAIRTGLKNAAGRTGMGAIMGSKRLKAVAARGTIDVKVSNPKRYLKYYLSQINKFRTLDPVEVISAQICRNIKPFEPIAAF